MTESEINEAMNSCLQIQGDLVAWSDFYPGIHGFIEVTELTPCTGCSTLENPNHGQVEILSSNRQSSSSIDSFGQYQFMAYFEFFLGRFLGPFSFEFLISFCLYIWSLVHLVPWDRDRINFWSF